MKRAGKGFLRFFIRQRKSTFFGNEALRKMCKKAIPEGKAEKGLIM
jgi:hypothetical protein